ncbi:MAG: chloramphenicol phosphotransferase [Rhizobiaceae bacterium]|nr:chloramphenicol phosphotransferase [Rhizobiaceae bacterium]
MTTIILLNGAGSSGKSSIARELQRIARRPLLHVQMDHFLEMLPQSLQDHPEGVHFIERTVDGLPAVEVTVGPTGRRLLRGMRGAVAALAAAGNDLIVDDVLLGDELREYRALLAGFDLHVVGVHASLDVLEQRELARGDRMPGLARWQVERVHRGKRYDFEVDTTATSAADCAAAIRERFRL